MKSDLSAMLLKIFQEFDIWKKEIFLYKSIGYFFKQQNPSVEFVVYSYFKKNIQKRIE